MLQLSWEDRLELQDLIFRYAELVDTGGSDDAFLQVFAPDAVIESPIIGEYVGIEGIKAFGRSMRESGTAAKMRHFVTNVRVSGEKDRALITAYFFQLNTKHGSAADPQDIETKFRIGGSYECKARKLNGRWMLESRKVLVDAMPQAKAE